MVGYDLRRGAQESITFNLAPLKMKLSTVVHSRFIFIVVVVAVLMVSLLLVINFFFFFLFIYYRST